MSARSIQTRIAGGVLFFVIVLASATAWGQSAGKLAGNACLYPVRAVIDSSSACRLRHQLRRDASLSKWSVHRRPSCGRERRGPPPSGRAEGRGGRPGTSAPIRDPLCPKGERGQGVWKRQTVSTRQAQAREQCEAVSEHAGTRGERAPCPGAYGAARTRFETEAQETHRRRLLGDEPRSSRRRCLVRIDRALPARRDFRARVPFR